jgi:hypothetical protein
MTHREHGLLVNSLRSLIYKAYTPESQVSHRSQNCLYLQLHCKGPTGKVSRMSAAVAVGIADPEASGIADENGGGRRWFQ